MLALAKAVRGTEERFFILRDQVRQGAEASRAPQPDRVEPHPDGWKSIERGSVYLNHFVSEPIEMRYASGGQHFEVYDLWDFFPK